MYCRIYEIKTYSLRYRYIIGVDFDLQQKDLCIFVHAESQLKRTVLSQVMTRINFDGFVKDVRFRTLIVDRVCVFDFEHIILSSRVRF